MITSKKKTVPYVILEAMNQSLSTKSNSLKSETLGSNPEQKKCFSGKKASRDNECWPLSAPCWQHSKYCWPLSSQFKSKLTTYISFNSLQK